MEKTENSGDLSAELEVACQLAREAADCVMFHYAKKSAVRFKDNDPSNPVTDADEAVNQLIVSHLAKVFPEDAILAEESMPHATRQRHARLWCVDPIDGTRDFVARGSDFAVMIGLAVNGQAKLGVVLAPRTMTLYAACPSICYVDHANGDGPSVMRVSRREKPLSPRLVLSRRANSQWVERVAKQLGVSERKHLGSVGLKVAKIACGEAELYLSPSSNTHEWDACAPEAIVHAAGGKMTDLLGSPLIYNQSDTRTRRGLLASNGSYHAAAVDAAISVRD